MEEYERLLRRALAIREATLPEDDRDLAGSREALALLLQNQGKAAAAAEILERLASTTEKVYGPEHPEVARTLLNLGLAYAALGRNAAAQRLFERSFAIDEKALEPGHPQRVRARETLAEHRREHGRPPETPRQP
jgi:tetratricopeptide (TPR) repeat protein